MDKFLKRKRDEITEKLEKPTKVVKKYDSDYMKYEFVSAGTDSEPRTQCVE